MDIEKPENSQKPKVPKSRIPRRQRQESHQFRNYPDFIDSLIIILVSAAVIIFIFWIASQTLNLNNFVRLPEFIQNTFSAIWTSIATGVTGIGLAVYKALTRKPNIQHPNYLLWIGIVVISLIGLILFILFILFILGRIAPTNTTNQNINSNIKTQNVEIDSNRDNSNPVTNTNNNRTGAGKTPKNSQQSIGGTSTVKKGNVKPTPKHTPEERTLESSN